MPLGHRHLFRVEVRRVLALGVLLAGVLTAMLASGTAGPSGAIAAGLTPCNSTPTGPIVTRDGEATLVHSAAGRKMLRRAGVKTTLIRPANSLTGRPTFPVDRIRFGASSTVRLRGGLMFTRGKRRIAARDLTVLVHRNRKRPARLVARLGARRIVLMRLSDGARKISSKRGEIDMIRVRASLTAAAATRLNRALGLKRASRSRHLGAAVRLDRFDLSGTYFVSRPDTPKVETPVEPPIADQPLDAIPISDAPGQPAIKWELRRSWIDYVGSGEKPTPGGGATPDAPEPPHNLVYSYNFPLKSGWTVPDPGTPDGPAAVIHGSGSLAFRFCAHSLNFKVSSPEIELNGPDSSRMIFRVDGTDATAFPDRRAVLVKLVPDRASQRAETTADGVKTVTWTRIPGFIPTEGTGIFAGFYPAGDPFGFLSLSYTIPLEGSP